MTSDARNAVSRAYMLPAQRHDWETPFALFDEIEQDLVGRFGQRFVLDVCATKCNAKCRRFYEASALSQPWASADGFWWCNPPYGRGIERWVEKGVTEGGGVMLLPARTDTKWFHAHLWNVVTSTASVELQFVRGRLRFVGSASSAPFPSMVVLVHRHGGHVAPDVP
jgi:phage N-6-adenine-methyltransferase